MITRLQQGTASPKRLRSAFAGAAVCSALAFGTMLVSPGAAVASTQTSPSVTAVSAEAGPSHTATSAFASCFVYWRTTTNYAGYTAGYSWAWNVVIRPGDTGDRVREIQCLANARFGTSLTVDGQYGSNTTAAVKKVQRSKGLVVDGIVGANTWRALRG